MKKTMAILFVAAALLGGCAASTSPAARADATRMYLDGASCAAVAAKLKVDRPTARALIRAGLYDASVRLARN